MEFCGAYVQGLFQGAGPYLFGPHVPGQPKKPIAVNRTAQRANFITMGLPIQEAVLVSAPAPKYTAKTTQPGRPTSWSLRTDTLIIGKRKNK